MKPKHLLIILSIACLFIASCKKHGERPAVVVDIYSAGYIRANAHLVAAYWKNGTLVRLGDSTVNTMANAIAVNGNDIYVAGSITNSEQITTAVIWKNGVATKLTDGTSNADARAITISGGNVYVAGYMNNLGAVYWKNGAVNDIQSSSVANAIAVNSGNIYVAGWLFDSGASNNEAALWKNGTPTEFIIHSPENGIDYIQGSASAVAVSNGDVYVTGYAGGGKYWKNGTEVDLKNGYSCYPAAIAVSGNDVYIAGSIDLNDPDAAISTANYWKNGNVVPLTSVTELSYANAIALNGTDVYIGGQASGSAVYWKNGKEVNLAANGAVNSIKLVSH
ncbi:MAG TPA: hypothetical protein VFE54_11470 [Mucilaginibacter sp.]|nr:hypothetical protein [Mucilaginibacter sp.]